MKARTWIPAVIILLGIGCALDFLLTGRDYIAYTLYLAAALIVIYKTATKLIKLIISLVLIAAIALFVMAEIPIVENSQGETDVDAAYVIVLGAAVHGSEPSAAMNERCDAAFAYLSSHPDALAILSGGQGEDEDLSEAYAMFLILKERGISEERLILEEHSTNTRENLANSFRIISERGDDPNGTSAVVTSEYHIYRAKIIAKSMGVDIKGIPADTKSLSVKINYFIREALGIGYEAIMSY